MYHNNLLLFDLARYATGINLSGSWDRKNSLYSFRHRGEYKKLPNHVEAFDQNGKSLGIIFQTASPFDTPMKMEALVKWTSRKLKKRDLYPLLVIGVFVVQFLAIHP
jgi:hypothetical protein